MSEPQKPVVYETFDEDAPSYLPSYILSAFALVALVSIAYHRIPLWPLSLAHPFIALWFGVLFYWMLQNARSQRQFSSDRLTVTGDAFRHTFRYAVAEATHVEMPLAEIEEVRISAEEPRYIEVVGKSESDMYFLPRGADVDRLVAALKAGNPAIRVIN
jgi:hypothetical protein